MRRLSPVIAVIAATGLVACVGILDRSTIKTVMPASLRSTDVDSACEAGVSLLPTLMAFAREDGTAPHRAAVLSLLSAGMCSEGKAWEAELRQDRALHRGDGLDAVDAREAVKRSHAEAAVRFHQAWQHLEAHYGAFRDGCPRLREQDGIVLLVGMTAGVNATLHDTAAGGGTGVPSSLVLDVQQAASCLDDEAWWGVPRGLQAVVELSTAGLTGRDTTAAWATLRASVDAGDAAGVRLPRAFAVLAHANAGDDAGLRAEIGAYVESLADRPQAADYALLDTYAGLMIRHASDRAWTRSVGHRTPSGALGTFPGAPPAVEDTGGARPAPNTEPTQPEPTQPEPTQPEPTQPAPPGASPEESP